ncbi:MAG: histidine kinase [Kibdelosporangium sp.]
MLTTHESLKRQSWLVAGVCMAADGFSTVLQGCSTPAQWAIVVGTVLVDAALAGPARLSGVVAVAHGVFAVVVALLVGGAPGNDAGMLVAGYRAGAWLRGIPAVISLGSLGASIAVAFLVLGRSTEVMAIVAVKVALLPWLVGRYTTARRAYLAELEQQSERERRDAQEAVTKAITEERSAIARDLHDVIVHHVSAIGMHAGAARLGLDSGSTRLEESLRAVETASRAAMIDLRHLLDILHGEQSEGARQPGLDNLDELFDGVRAAGMPARLHISGTPREVPESLDITLYRIVQEMLTNGLRHGDPSGVDIFLDYRPGAVAVTADNPVGDSTEPSTEPRRGLVGIRNRASLFKGRTAYGLEPDGRTWRTVVTFPLEDS